MNEVGGGIFFFSLSGSPLGVGTSSSTVCGWAGWLGWLGMGDGGWDEGGGPTSADGEKKRRKTVWAVMKPGTWQGNWTTSGGLQEGEAR